MTKVRVAALYGRHDIYSKMPPRMFEALEAAFVSGEMTAEVYVSDLVACFAV